MYVWSWPTLIMRDLHITSTSARKISVYLIRMVGCLATISHHRPLTLLQNTQRCAWFRVSSKAVIIGKATKILTNVLYVLD